MLFLHPVFLRKSFQWHKRVFGKMKKKTLNLFTLHYHSDSHLAGEQMFPNKLEKCHVVLLFLRFFQLLKRKQLLFITWTNGDELWEMFESKNPLGLLFWRLQTPKQKLHNYWTTKNVKWNLKKTIILYLLKRQWNYK